MEMSKKFSGFPQGKVTTIPVPEPFFTELLVKVDDLVELKTLLYMLWALNQQDGDVRYLRRSDVLLDQAWLAGLSDDHEHAIALCDQGFEKASARGVIFILKPGEGLDVYYLLNTPRGRSLLEAFHEGNWTPGKEKNLPVGLDLIKPNIFKLYEQNIGPLTPIIAEYLKEAEKEYPLDWIDEAFRIAVANNVRKWKYIQAILRSWKERGKDDENRRDTQEGYRKYLEGDYARFIED
jgi:DnaD/phage-associated family protein